MNRKTRKKVVIVEALIGAGKSTLTKELGKALGPTTLIQIEPDEKDGANPYLADYYGEPSRWSFTMQCHLLALRYRMHLHAQWHTLQGRGHAVMDRSYFGDTAFAHLQLQSGLMSQHEFNTYSSLYQAMTANVLLPSVCLRLSVLPETAQARIQSRKEKELGRKCESAISLDYLRSLDREIDHMVNVLRQQGVVVWDVPWDPDRDTPKTRKQTIQGLVHRIETLEPQDMFLDMHRRSL